MVEHPLCQQFEVQLSIVWRSKFMKIMKFDLKWVHIARYEFILRLDGALWLRIIFGLWKSPTSPERSRAKRGPELLVFYIYTGPRIRPPNAGYWELQRCHLVFPARLGRFCPRGIEVERHGFQTAWLITGQTNQGLGLNLMAVILTFRDLSSHLCQTMMRMARWRDLKIWMFFFQNHCLREFEAPGTGIFKTFFCGTLKNETQTCF